MEAKEAKNLGTFWKRPLTEVHSGSSAARAADGDHILSLDRCSYKKTVQRTKTQKMSTGSWSSLQILSNDALEQVALEAFSSRTDQS